MRVARRYVVRGRVQGVGFRYFVRAAAERERVDGWVRNLSDGSVEAVAAGESERLRVLEHALREGPPASRVDDVTVDDSFPFAGPPGFFIR